MLHSVAATAVLVSVLSAPDASEAEVVWTVGLSDDRPAEFALGRDEAYAQYPKGFPSDVTFRVGSSDPAREFCYIHPGPMDVWAGSRAHDVRVTFSLDGSPSGSYMLTLDLCRSHYAFPPALDVEAHGVYSRLRAVVSEATDE